MTDETFFVGDCVIHRTTKQAMRVVDVTASEGRQTSVKARYRKLLSQDFHVNDYSPADLKKMTPEDYEEYMA